MADRIAYRQPQTGNQGFARTMKTLGGAFALVVADLAINRTTGLLVVPKGFVCTGVYFSLTDVDTNGSPALLVTIGDAASAARLVASSNIGQAGGSTSTLAAAGLYYEFTDNTEIIMTVATAAATAAVGTGSIYLTGFMK